ncbi:SMI1/KNR4 family protein [Streptomyces sp. NPDC101150]|uniref:SMI1/KNR4 family protein n=1 Tax=Streptomyces sp. NPDC101150 TaxID=3366114 RepID=UPI0037F92F84
MSQGTVAWEGVVQAWQRVTVWLERHAPATARTGLAPAAPEMIGAAEERMGVVFPAELRAWLLGAGLDGDPDDVLMGVLPGISGLLGVRGIERVYAFKMEIERDDPSEEPEFAFWQEGWIPVCSDSDACYGRFMEVSTGRIGSFSDGDVPSFGDYPSLAALFGETADAMERISSGAPGAPGAVESGRLLWH